MTFAGAVYLTAIAAAIIALLWRARRWRAGQPGSGSIFAGLLALPQRYLVNVHDVVARDPPAARMHLAAAGGFVALNLLILGVHVAGLRHVGLIMALVAAALLTLAGATLDIVRRSGKSRPARLPGRFFEYFPFALAAFALYYGMESLVSMQVPDLLLTVHPIGIVVTVLGMAGTAFLIPGLALGPMRHAVAGALHLVLHPRPERFAGTPSTALRTLDLDSPRLGATQRADFSRPQLISFDACVECGRCDEVCPANAAGTGLKPRSLIRSLATAHPANTALVGTAEDSLAAVIDPNALWACTTCRACVEACPMMIEHVDAIIDLRRFQTMEQGATPGKGPAVLEALQQTDSLCGKITARRPDWAIGLDLPLAREGTAFDVLLWQGEQAFDPRGQRTLGALVSLLKMAHVDFAFLGADEMDTGDTARRMGDEAGFQRLARSNIETLARFRFSRIVTCDPHVLQCIGTEYPAFGGHYRVSHATSFIADLVECGHLSLQPTVNPGTVTYHDPCYLGRYSGEYDAPRALLRAIGIEPVEMARSRETSFCCGWGGAAAITDVPARQRMPDLRLQQARDMGASRVAVACPNCAVMFDGTSNSRVVIEDVIELVAKAAQPARGSVA